MLRKTFPNNIRRLILLGICILIISCDGKLSRSEAAKLISENQKFSEPMTGEMPTEFVNKGYLFKPVNGKLFSVLISLGYIEIINPGLYEKYVLTEKGKKEEAFWRKTREPLVGNLVYDVPIFKRELVEVTGISEPNMGENSVQATFTWRWQPIREIGEAMVDGKVNENPIFKGNATLQKFDDGWRTVNVSGKGITDLW